jgi:DNA modification methylase
MSILIGNAIEVLRTLPDASVDCCVTSPPYFGLREYGTARWEGGNARCKHRVGELRRGVNLAQSPASTRGGAKKAANREYLGIDLNPAYAKMARARIAGAKPLARAA